MKPITAKVIGFIGYCLFTRLFQSFEDKERQEAVSVDKTILRGNIAANVSDLVIEHNVNRHGKIGMNLSSKQTFQNLKGTTCYTMIRFFDDQIKPLKGKSACDEHGNFCIIGKLTPDNDDCTNDQHVFVSYDQFDLPDSGIVYFFCDIRLFITNNDGERIELAHSNPSRFHLSH